MSYLMVLEFDDFLTTEDQDLFEDLLFVQNFPWFYTFSATYDDDGGGDDFSFFRHMFIWDTYQASPYAHLIRRSFGGLFDLIGSEPRTVRANMTTRKDARIRTQKHTDLSKPHIVGLYYVNNADGDTIFFNGEQEERMTPKKGKLIVFDGGTFHAAEFPNVKDRAVINFVFPTSRTVAEIAAEIGLASESNP